MNNRGDTRGAQIDAVYVRQTAASLRQILDSVNAGEIEATASQASFIAGAVSALDGLLEISDGPVSQ